MSGSGVRQLHVRPLGARFRSRRVCTLVAGTRLASGRLRELSAAGAILETNARPALGEEVLLRHPEAGEIDARVSRHTRDGIGLSFPLDERAVAFAMLALAIDMTRRPLALI
jgi:hypothetical protein